MDKKENVLISACLLGLGCRYDGQEKSYCGIRELMEECHLVPVCPEQLGGLETPRKPAERIGDKVMNCGGKDVTEAYMRGGKETLKAAQLYGCRYALLKEKSPSCGCGKIYDGTFSGVLTDGDGVAAGILKENGIKIFGETETDLLEEELKKEEGRERKEDKRRDTL